MSRSSQFVTAITVLVVAAAVLPVVGVGTQTGGSGATAPKVAVDTTDTPDAENNTTVSLWAGPPGLAERVEDASDLPERVGDPDRRSQVVPTDGSLVVHVRVPGLDARVRNATGANLTERFLAVADDPRFELRVSAFAGAGSLRSRFAALDPVNATVVRGDSPDTFALVFDPATVPAVPTGRSVDLSYVGDETGGPVAFTPPDEQLEATQVYYGVDVTDALSADGGGVLARVPPTMSVQPRAPGVAFVDRTDATFGGLTSLPPGTNVSIRIETADGETVATRTATVRPGGTDRVLTPNTWSTTVDATELPADADLSVVATADWDGRSVTEGVDAAVVPNESLAEPRLRIQRVSNDTDPTELPAYVGLDGPSTPTVLLGDDLVVTVQSAVIAAEVAEAPGDTLTERFAAAWTGDTRVFVGLYHQSGHGEPWVYDLSDVTNVTVVAGDAPATYHVVVDSSKTDVFRGPPVAENRDHEFGYLSESFAYFASFDVFGYFDPAVIGLPPNRTTEVETPAATIVEDAGGALLQQPSGNVTVTGRTSLPLSGSITVELLDANSSTVVERRRTTPTPPFDPRSELPSRFAVTFDHDIEGGVDYTVRVGYRGRNLTERVPLEVVPREASLTFEDQTGQWGATLNRTNLTHGGFVVLRNGSIDGEMLASPEYVYPGDSRAAVQFDEAIANRTTVVAVAYRDVNANSTLDADDEPYLENGTPVTATAVISPPAETTTPTSTVSGPTTTARSPTSTTATVGLADRSETPGDGSTPGFGVIAAVAALSAVGVLRRVRGW